MFYTNDPYFQVKEHVIPLKGLDKEMLAEVLVTFGADPIFAGAHNYFTCSYTNYCKSVREFLTTNIDGELSAADNIKIHFYTFGLTNPVSLHILQ